MSTSTLDLPARYRAQGQMQESWRMAVGLTEPSEVLWRFTLARLSVNEKGAS